MATVSALHNRNKTKITAKMLGNWLKCRTMFQLVQMGKCNLICALKP